MGNLITFIHIKYLIILLRYLIPIMRIIEFLILTTFFFKYISLILNNIGYPVQR